MKKSLYHFLFCLAALGLPLGALRAAGPGATILSDDQLAAIKGGWCPFEVCEDPPGTGVCQPVPDTVPALCGVTRCGYDH